MTAATIPPESAVIADGLVKRFGDFTAVDHVSFSIAPGEIVGFLGPNGAGKSTTIRILCGLLQMTEGQATVAGIDVRRNPEAVREHIGYMSQKFSLYGDLTVAENLRFFGGIYRVPRAQLRERTQFAIDMAGLGGREGALVNTLAGGWKQRLALGCAILHRPPILFLDEPTSGVDPESRRRFWDLIHDLSADGVSILVSTHYMDEAEYCNRIALINRGRLVVIEKPGVLKRHNLGGDLFNIQAPAVGPLLAALQDFPGHLEASVFGNAVHLLVRDGLVAVNALPAFLNDRGIPLHQIRPIAPSLEDVFVRLVSNTAAESPKP